jgi:hypothetical protein
MQSGHSILPVIKAIWTVIMPWILLKARNKKIVGVLLNLYLTKNLCFPARRNLRSGKGIPGFPDLLKHVCDQIIFIKK